MILVVLQIVNYFHRRKCLEKFPYQVVKLKWLNKKKLQKYLLIVKSVNDKVFKVLHVEPEEHDNLN